MTQVDDTLRLAYLKYAYSEIKAEELALRRTREFYEGEQGISLTARQREYLGDIANDVDDQALCNISRRAVEIPLERLAVETIDAGDDSGGTMADMARVWWNANQMNAWQYDIYETALRDGQSCLIIGWDGKQPTMALNQLYDGVHGNVRLHYSGDDGSLMFASKRYQEWDAQEARLTGKTRLTLYFPDRVERYRDSTSRSSGWVMLTEEEAGMPNPQPWVGLDGEPLGIPVVTFDNPGMSELDSILMPQKALNKSLADLLSAQDMHGFPLLALKGYKSVIGTDGKPSVLKLAPGEAITMPPDGDLIRMQGADLSPMFETGVMSWLQLCTIIKGWPLYLWARGEPPSGESLKVMESSLVSQVKRKQESFGDSWLEVFGLCARMHRRFTGVQLTGQVKTTWRDPQTRNELLEWQAKQTKWDAAQVPVRQRWLEAGYSETQVQEMEQAEINTAVRAAQQSVLSAIMAQRTLGAGGNNPALIDVT